MIKTLFFECMIIVLFKSYVKYELQETRIKTIKIQWVNPIFIYFYEIYAYKNFKVLKYFFILKYWLDILLLKYFILKYKLSSRYQNFIFVENMDQYIKEIENEWGMRSCIYNVWSSHYSLNVCL